LFLTYFIVQVFTFLIFALLAFILVYTKVQGLEYFKYFIIGGVAGGIAYQILYPFQYFILLLNKGNIYNYYEKSLTSNFGLPLFFYWFFLIFLIELIRFISQNKINTFNYSKENAIFISIGWTVAQMTSLIYLTFIEISRFVINLTIFEIILVMILFFIWNYTASFFVHKSKDNTKFLLFITFTSFFFYIMIYGILAFPNNYSNLMVLGSLFLITMLHSLLAIIQVKGEPYFIKIEEEKRQKEIASLVSTE
jgi:hypothetical protein